jgi:hypothetical protein
MESRKMIYGTFKDSVLDSVGCGDDLPSGAIQFPDEFAGMVGMHRDEFESSWAIKPLSVRVAAGLIVIPQGYKLEGEEVVPMNLTEQVAAGLVKVEASQVLDTKHGDPYIREKTPNERIRDKIDSRPKGYKIVEDSTTFDGLALIPLSLVEQVSMGDITQQTADVIQALSARAERDSRFEASDDAHLQLAREIRVAAKTGTNTAAIEALLEKWDAYADALSAVPDQGGFPWIIDWPARPDGVSE